MKHREKALIRTWGIAVVTAATLAGPSVGHASLAASSSVCYTYASGGPPTSFCADGSDPGQGSPVSIPGGSGTGSGVVYAGSSAGALQDYGVFHGYAKAAGAGIAYSGTGGGANAGAVGTMHDSWVLSGGTGLGYLTLAWTVTGETALDGYHAALAYLYMDIETTSGGHTTSNTRLIDQAGTYTFSKIPFVFGQPLQFDVTSTVHASSGFDPQPTAYSYAYYAAADFGHTSILSGIDAYDAAGNPIDGLVITAASGARYPVMVDAPGDPTTPGTVPEPASEALLVAGFFAAGWTRLRKTAARAGHRFDVRTRPA